MAEGVHGTVVVAAARGVLLRGPSGSGKSDLALRLLALPAGPLLPEPFRLVADDQVVLSIEAGEVVARCPSAIAGLVEVRGVGLVWVDSVAAATIRLVVDLVAADAVPRLPLDETVPLLGITVPRLQLAAFEASAPVKVACALFAPHVS